MHQQGNYLFRKCKLSIYFKTPLEVRVEFLLSFCVLLRRLINFIAIKVGSSLQSRKSDISHNPVWPRSPTHKRALGWRFRGKLETRSGPLKEVIATTLSSLQTAQRLSTLNFKYSLKRNSTRPLKSHSVYLVEICKLSIDHLVAASPPEQTIKASVNPPRIPAVD